jgi:hypothetical protein
MLAAGWGIQAQPQQRKAMLSITSSSTAQLATAFVWFAWKAISAGLDQQGVFDGMSRNWLGRVTAKAIPLNQIEALHDLGLKITGNPGDVG